MQKSATKYYITNCMNIDDSNDDFDVGYCLKNKDVLKCV